LIDVSIEEIFFEEVVAIQELNPKI